MIIDMKPADTPDYMLEAWLVCMYWAIGDPATLQAFRAETGHAWKPGRTGLERMIDEATGVDREFIRAFIAWANIRVWGPIADQ